MKDKGASLQTYSGRRFYFLTPTPDSIHILDIAHALSMMCRFNGHTVVPYYVGDHSIRASELAPHRLKMQALMHDASEAYVADITRGLKEVIGGDYAEVENRIMKAVARKYGFGWPTDPVVKGIDDRLLVTERRDLLVWADYKWKVDAPWYADIIVPRSQHETEVDFLKAFNYIRTHGGEQK